MKLYSPQEFLGLRRAGYLAADVLRDIAPVIVPGLTTLAINDRAEAYMRARGGIPAPLGYRGYPKATCTSVNHVVCHGIPSTKMLCNGDIINVDVTVILDGFYGDTSRMYYVGHPSVKARRLVETTQRCLDLGLEEARPGRTLGDIGHAIQKFAEARGFSVVREYTGHGIGTVFHDEPTVFHFGEPGMGLKLVPGMVFTIEPMINAGKPGVKTLHDGWTVVTRDRSLSAQFEHTLGITEEGHEVFTRGTDVP